MKAVSLPFVVLLLAMAFQLHAQVEHPDLNTSVSSADGSFTITLVNRKQNYTNIEKTTLDKDIRSPKSVIVHPNGKKFYVNSLEGAKTIVFSTETNDKLKVIAHKFREADSLLWSEPSGLFEFTHYLTDLNTFRGRPVESAFSHGGRYIWVPYYRRSYDLNAQDPSAVAVIDTENDSIVRLMETGPLPKMIAVSDDGCHVAITHWGDNTVGLIHIEGDSPDQWFYEDCVTVKWKMKLDYPLDSVVNRDVGSGLSLRGTVFTPDGRYLLVGCMGGKGGIGVIDMNDFSYLGHVYGMKSNLRHMVIRNDYIYLSINKDGYIQRIPLAMLYDAIGQMEGGKVTLSGWESCKVAEGARTIDITPDGRYLLAACHFGSCLVVVDTETFIEVARIQADPYPVGLAISKDGRYVYTTSQGRDGEGGNCVDIFKMDY